MRDDGHECRDDIEASAELCRHWRFFFQARRIHPQYAELLLREAVRWPDDIAPIVSREDFLEIVARPRFSCPGPDGVSFSALHCGGAALANAMYDSYVLWTQGRPLPDAWRASFTVFLPKASRGGDDMTRRAGDTRPITLSNAIEHMFMGALNVPLRRCAERCLDPRQRGFVPGRIPSDNILGIEAHLEEWASLHDAPSGAILLDVEAAFPSVSHAWLHRFFKHRGAPAAVCRCLQMAYSGLSTVVSFGASCTRSFRLRAGVRQGCPASGSVFAMLLDPWVRLLGRRLPAPDHVVAVYADDVALGARSLVEIARPLAAAATVLQRATGLRMKGSKCLAVACRAGDAPDIAAALDATCVFRHSSVVESARYLGVTIGPDSDASQCRGAIDKFWERTVDVVQGSWSQSERVRLFRIRAVSVLRYLLSFRAPSEELVRVYSRACQTLWKIPFNSIPTAAMSAVGELGLLAVPNLEDLSRASRVANVLRSCLFDELRQGSDDDERRMLAPRQADWCRAHLFAFGVRFIRAHPSAALLWRSVPSRRVKRRVLADLADARDKFDFLGLARRRVAALGVPPNDGVLRDCLANLRSVAKKCMPAAVAVFKMMCNAWPVASRFGDHRRPCAFCGDARETLPHLARCDIVGAAIRRHLGNGRNDFGWGRGLECVLFAVSRTPICQVANVAAECILHTAMRAHRHGVQPHLLVHARLRELVRRFPNTIPGAPPLRRRRRRR